MGKELLKRVHALEFNKENMTIQQENSTHRVSFQSVE